MKKILIPIDFTQASKNAVQFAMKLFPDANYDLIHVRTGMFNTAEPIGLGSGMTQEMFWKETVEHFIKNELDLNKIPKSINIKIVVGGIVGEIIDYQKKEQHDTVVMATKDKYGPFDRWFGTISLGVIKSSPVPVYLIPRYARYSGFRRVIVGADSHLNDDKYLERIRDWNNRHTAFIKFIHIQEGLEDDFIEERRDLIEALFENEDPNFAFEVEILKDNDISKSLLATAYNSKADLIIISPEKDKLIKRVFLKSITREMIMKSNIPVLFLTA